MQKIALSTSTVPGMYAPAASWEQPFEMLHACHERAVRMLDLLVKMQAHAFARGVDEQVRQAASDVIRYFDIAAPLHHQDEELHIIPVALAAGDTAVAAAAVKLTQEHAMMDAVWRGLRMELQALTVHGHLAPLPDAWRTDHLARAFHALYSGHIGLEEQLVYPYVQKRLAVAQANAMGREMAARRTAPSLP